MTDPPGTSARCSPPASARALWVVSGLALAACGGRAGSRNSADASGDVASSSDAQDDGDSGHEASVCRSAGFGAPTSYSTAYPPSSLFVYSPTTGGVPNVIAIEPGGAPNAAFELFANGGNGGFALARFQGAIESFSVAADFSGDGLDDNAGVSSTGDGGVLQIDKNTGAGTFATQLATYPISQLRGNAAAGDFDKNGHPDIAIAGATIYPRPDGLTVAARGLDVFLNDGHGSFGSPVIYPDDQGYVLDQVAAADFDGDGSLDLALFPEGLLLNSGTGTFGTELPLPALPGDAMGPFQQYWAVGDFNGDGKSDLVASVVPDEIAVFLAVGGGSFAAPATYVTRSTPSVVAVGDFNGDSHPDVMVLLDGQTGSSSLELRLNQGDGTFGAATTLALGPYADSISVADFNGDGVTDVAVTNDGFFASDAGAPSSFTVVLSQCR